MATIQKMSAQDLISKFNIKTVYRTDREEIFIPLGGTTVLSVDECGLLTLETMDDINSYECMQGVNCNLYNGLSKLNYEYI